MFRTNYFATTGTCNHNGDSKGIDIDLTMQNEYRSDQMYVRMLEGCDLVDGHPNNNYACSNTCRSRLMTSSPDFTKTL